MGLCVAVWFFVAMCFEWRVVAEAWLKYRGFMGIL